MELKTPLYDIHVAANGKIVPFAGYLLPVQYPTGVIKEHMAVRQQAGLFDVSHMGEVTITGPDALKNIQNLLTNDLAGMYDGQVRYSPMCNENGGVIDDLLVYQVNPEHYFLVVNAANRPTDVAWMKAHLFGNAILTDISDDIAQLALQGPSARPIIEKLCSAEELPSKYYSFTEKMNVAGHPCLVSRTGYTGELGYEIYCSPRDVADIWAKLLEAGAEEGLIPCGLGARDTLRLEAGMPLYGHEMNTEVTPLETGLEFFVKMDKGDFIGKAAMASSAPKTKRIGIEVTGKGIAREHFDLYLGDKLIGRTTSGTQCPFIGKPVAMALVAPSCPDETEELFVDIRGRMTAAKTTPLPFYSRPKKTK